jgi:hypothetical protein
VVVSHVTPWPAAAGNEYRLARLISWLESRGFDVHLVYRPFRETPLGEHEVRQLAERYPRLYVVDPRGPSVTFATDVPEAYAAMIEISRRPARVHDRELAAYAERLEPRVLDLTRSFAPDPLIGVVAGVAGALQPLAVIALYIFMAPVLRFVPRGTLRMLDLIDVFSSKQEKVLRFGVDDSFAVSTADEAFLIREADVAIAIQADESNAVRALVPDRRVITAGIDCPVVDEIADPIGHRVLMVGSDNPLNKAGLAAFLRYAWPLVLRSVPDAELAVVGSVGRILSGAETGVAVLGRVDDIDDAYASARVAINPAVAGTGVKVKTLEAIAHLRPIVVWPSGIEGVPETVRRACSIATNWSMFARHVIEQLSRPALLAQLRSDRALVAEALSADATYAELRQALEGNEVGGAGVTAAAARPAGTAGGRA